MSESRPVPASLAKDMIVEAIFEIRFTSEIEALGELLPGLIFPHVRAEFPKLEKLPLASLPKEVVQNDPSLFYQPTARLVGDNQILLVGDRVFGLSHRKPYLGWPGFKPQIIRLAGILHDMAGISEIERYSLRYTNIIPCGNGSRALDAIRATMLLADWNVADVLFQMRAEVSRGAFLNVIQIASGASVTNSHNVTVDGLLVDIDTMRHGPFPDYWDNLVNYIEEAHQCEKEVFFSLLTDQTLNEAGPVW